MTSEKPKVRAWAGEEVIPTYLPHLPDKNPMFLEKRVYQGSSGKVYPLPFTDRISETKTNRAWKAVWLENEYLKVMILPEIGGRIHAIVDKTSGCDVIYRQTVIKPALVGLAGPWISGGIEFNWPQHHRPATFLPVDYQIEEHSDGSCTVWCSDHDPMARMKGMHGVCLHPDKAYLELKVRAYNRTPFVQTFLWWANFATRVHEGYQSFFPPHVRYVADHAKRAMSEYPLCQGFYYGVDYGQRGHQGVPPSECPSEFVPPSCRDEAGQAQIAAQVPSYAPNDLSWYANIPVPTSYMALGSQGDFFGGYDCFQQAGVVHVADHHISPGKKQWTWGNHEFGYAWDRNLTDTDGPYIELMAGVYTDNQPDFSFLQPGETKSFSQFWYPIQKIGPAKKANREAAVRLDQDGDKGMLGVSVSSGFPGTAIRLESRGELLHEWAADLAPGQPFLAGFPAPGGVEGDLTLRVLAQGGKEIIAYSANPSAKEEAPQPATEPLLPHEITSADELYLTGLHLEQYRHATRSPVPYWREALRRDPLDARCNNALGLWHLRRGEYADAEERFRRAIERLTRRNPNPYDGEPFYNLGLCLRFQLDAFPTGSDGSPLFDDSYSGFYKATWNQAWAGAGFHALAEMDCRRGDWTAALEHLNRSLRFDTDHLRARNLKAVTLRKLGRDEEADALLRETLALDPLDWWARQLNGERLGCDMQTSLDIAHDFARAGLYGEAVTALQDAMPGPAQDTPSILPTQSWGTEPLLRYTLAWLHEKQGRAEAAAELRRQAEASSPDYCFPYRLEDITVLESALRAHPEDARASYYLGNLFYDRRRQKEAIALWEQSAKADPSYSVVWRNLGIGYFNIANEPSKASAAYAQAVQADPSDARLLFERDQLWKRMGETPEKRLREIERHPTLVSRRDDLSVELGALYNQTGQPEQALALMESRAFQPWEGGEGQALSQYARAHLALGRRALAAGKAAAARDHFGAALTPPQNLGETKHLLANQSDIHYWLGAAYSALGDRTAAEREWTVSAGFRGDFQEMSVRRFSEMTYYSALSWKRLGQEAEARELLNGLLEYARDWEKAPAKIDYFATSLPTMLLFDEDIQARQQITALFLQSQALAGIENGAQAKSLLSRVLELDPNHAPAADLLAELAD